MRRRRCVVAATALAIALGACGVPEDGKPQVVSARDVPFGLLETTTSTTSTTVSLPTSVS